MLKFTDSYTTYWRKKRMVKTIEELAVDISTTEISVLVPRILLREIDVAARAARRARSLVRINRDLVGAKGRSIIVPKRGQLTAVAVSEGSTFATGGVSYDGTTITPTKIGLGVRISQESMDGAEIDIINDIVKEAGEALAEKEDQDIIAVFTAANAVGSTIPSTTANTLVYEDIVTARTSVISRNYKPTILFIHPDQEGDILKNDKFIDTSKYGGREPILNGEVGKISGLKTLVTQNMPTGNALIIDPTRAAWMSIKRDVQLKRKDEASTDSIELYFYQEYASSIVNTSAVAIITNC